MEWSAELDNLSKLAPDVGLEPTTDRLTADCSTYWANQEYRIRLTDGLWSRATVLPLRE